MNSTPTIALLHGWATDPKIWESVRAEIEARSIAVVVYEMPGYGSRSEAIGNLTFDELVDDAIGQLPSDAIWVGWSLGAMIAISASARAGAKFAGLLGVSATAKFCCDLAKTESLIQLRQAVEDNPEKAVKRFQRSMPSPANRRSVIKQLGELRPPRPLVPRSRPSQGEGDVIYSQSKQQGDVCVASKETLLAGLDVLSRADLNQEVNKIGVPVRLISGEEDPIIPAAAAITLNELIPGSQFTSLPCGHLPFLECPQLFMEQLFEFVQTITDSPTDSESV